MSAPMNQSYDPAASQMPQDETAPSDIQLSDDKRRTVERYRIANRTVKPGGIVCAGSSLMEFFPVEQFMQEAGIDLNLHNRGISGFVCDELYAYLDVCVLALRPSRMVINIGTNDLNDPATTDAILRDRYERILTAVEQALPGIEIMMMAYYPVNADVATDDGILTCLASRTNERLQAANRVVESLAERHHARYLDVNSVLTDEQGRLKTAYTLEGMHLNEAGYRAMFPDFLHALLTW